MSARVHILGVRHHGPGSARSVSAALQAIAPDVVLLEGPPEADALIPLVAHPEMAPPVALLIYRPDAPSNAVYYPFAVFSPEWQGLSYATSAGVPARFIDLPLTHQLGPEPEADEGEPAEVSDDAPPVNLVRQLRTDPLQILGEAAGFADGEAWWEHIVEHRRDGADQFAAIREAIAAVRGSLSQSDDLRELRREAFMRKSIRAARSEGFQNIAVICGAWHAPVLEVDAWPSVASDNALLKGLPKVKLAATWTPWTYDRLTASSGYGAGVRSPGWYDHLWSVESHVVEHWLSRVARLLRGEGLDASSASVIESVRLAEALAALRGRYLPGLDELNEACRAVLCFGDDLPLRLIERKLIVGERLGQVPPETPTVPLVQDLERLRKKLRLPAEPFPTTKTLDLREPNDLERSRLLHRLNLLNVPWGQVERVSGQGTFKEAWQLAWQPEFAVLLIEASLWGETVLDAATARARDLAEKAAALPELTALIERAILADLPGAVDRIMQRLEDQASLSSDVAQLMEALPPLGNLLRYGNVRQTDASMVRHAASGLITRVCIGLPNACASLDDTAANAFYQAISKAALAIPLIDTPGAVDAWQAALETLSRSDSLHGLIAGRATRLLLDIRAIDEAETARRMGLAVSPASTPAAAAAWVEGFLRASGDLLLHDDALFRLVDGWLTSLAPEAFSELLPLLRRTFAEFPGPLRRNLGTKARSTTVAPSPATGGSSSSSDFDPERGEAVLPLVARLLGLTLTERPR